jgi:hypothetical protein
MRCFCDMRHRGLALGASCCQACFGSQRLPVFSIIEIVGETGACRFNIIKNLNFHFGSFLAETDDLPSTEKNPGLMRGRGSSGSNRWGIRNMRRFGYQCVKRLARTSRLTGWHRRVTSPKSSRKGFGQFPCVCPSLLAISMLVD